MPDQDFHQLLQDKLLCQALVVLFVGKKYLKKGDEVIISTLEHHANIVPWQMICKQRKALHQSRKAERNERNW